MRRIRMNFVRSASVTVFNCKNLIITRSSSYCVRRTCKSIKRTSTSLDSNNETDGYMYTNSYIYRTVQYTETRR